MRSNTWESWYSRKEGTVEPEILRLEELLERNKYPRIWILVVELVGTLFILLGRGSRSTVLTRQRWRWGKLPRLSKGRICTQI